MPVPAMAQPAVDHQRRFQAAVDVIHNLPKDGSYRPSYEVMLRFYSLYKQAVCGPCIVPRPGFWDPVGRYKWDAWSRLGQMSPESAMAAYVEEMKKVAQEVIDTMPMTETTASLFHHFEPLYRVIDDMPQPPASLLTLTQNHQHSGCQTDVKDEEETSEEKSEGGDLNVLLNVSEVGDLTANIIPSAIADPGMLTSDSESEIFCDSVDSVEQLSNIKIPVIKSNGFHNDHVSPELYPAQGDQQEGHLEGRQVGSGHGGEGAEDGRGQRSSQRNPETGREASYHNWRECGAPQGSRRRAAPDSGGSGGAGRGGGGGSEGGLERRHDAHLQQQIILALRRLREDMRSVMERLEVVERLAASHAQDSECRPCLQCAALASQQEETWWPFDVSGQTILLFLLWPFVAQGVVYLMKKVQQRSRTSS
ncbi:acyl-CoA-binding domain-containing protein 4 isoform X1 [Kryptolebias marmoratus]|uniref:Acyl-CoA binding domain containing 4 n=1 Tax=Kryptolebias marmoratus TaxID=37003 RepID=A0A3Q3ATL7_KRYMA|nr:acyl-CoA-binding domain-containing protein 4 isoform X1 [Kryptolebias marmoratus]